MTDCLFCKIIKGDIPSTKVYEDSDFLAFLDIKPSAKVHILVVPKKHISLLNDINDSNIDYIGKILLVGKKIAKQEGLQESGYRFTFNCNDDAGMEISHIHLHILGGEKLGKIC